MFLRKYVIFLIIAVLYKLHASCFCPYAFVLLAWVDDAVADSWGGLLQVRFDVVVQFGGVSLVFWCSDVVV